MSTATKIILSIAVIVIVGGGTAYVLRVENKVVVETPAPSPAAQSPREGQPVQQTRPLGRQVDLRPLEWGKEQKKP